MVQVVCPACLTANRVPGERLGDRPVELDEANFDAVVGRTELPVVVDFWAPWCGPCRAMASAFEAAAGELASRVRFAKVNTDQAQSLAERYGIRGIPTLILFNQGKEAARVSGALDKRSLLQWIAGA